MVSHGDFPESLEALLVECSAIGQPSDEEV